MSVKRFYLFLLRIDNILGFHAFSKKQNIERKFPDNRELNICRFFHVLAQFLFNTSISELDYYQQKANVQLLPRGDERLKI